MPETDPNNPNPNPNPNPDPNAAAAQAFQNLLQQRNNDALGLASQLFDENFRYRQTIRDLKTASPKNGEIVLTAEQTARWNAYEAIGLGPQDIADSLANVSRLTVQNKELAGMESLRELAEIGIDGSKLKLNVLKDQLAKFPDAVLTFKTEKDKDGKEVKVAYIRPDEQPESKEQSFNEFAKTQFADYLPALKVEADQKREGVQQGNGPDPKPHSQTDQDSLKKEIQAQVATGRYAL